MHRHHTGSERGTYRQTKTDKHILTNIDTHTHTHTLTDTQSHTHQQRHKPTPTNRQREIDIYRQTKKDINHRQTHRHIDTHTDTHTQTQTHTHTLTHTQKNKGNQTLTHRHPSADKHSQYHTKTLLRHSHTHPFRQTSKPFENTVLPFPQLHSSLYFDTNECKSRRYKTTNET